MSLRERLDQDMKLAMRNKEQMKLSVIRMIKSAIQKAEMSGARRTLTDEEVLDVIVGQVKQRQESIAEYEKAGRTELAQTEKEEMAILQSYLPAQLTEDELRALIQQVIQEVGATSKADLGKVMGAIMPKVKGKADGRVLNRLVQESLS